MAKSATPSAMFDLPLSSGRGTLRAGLLAMGILPNSLPADRTRREHYLRTLGDHPRTVVFLDISLGRPGIRSTLLELDAWIPRNVHRKRVFLTRLAGGYISEADRRWVRALGFADLLSDFDAQDRDGSLRAVLGAVAELLALPALEQNDLTKYLSALNSGSSAPTARGTIRQLTQFSAENLALALHRGLDIQDRSYRLKTFPKCFVGDDAVAWIAKRFGCAANEAIAIGQALGDMGLLHHVAHDHPFLNEWLFYRLAISERADGVDLNEALIGLSSNEGVPVSDRTHLGKTYARCWIGSEAVDHVCARYALARHEAWIVLHKLMQFGAFEHVTQDRPFIDGAFYYRFIPAPRIGNQR